MLLLPEQERDALVKYLENSVLPMSDGIKIIKMLYSLKTQEQPKVVAETK